MIGRMAWRRFLAGALVALCAAPAIAAPAEEQAVETEQTAPARLTVASAIEQALQQRPLLDAGEARIGAARARVTQARSTRYPQITIQASVTDGPLGSPPLGLGGLVGTPLKTHYGGSLNVTQILLDWGRTHNTIRARQQEAESARESLRADENRVTLEVQLAYYQALQAQRLLGINRQILTQRQLVARQAEIMRENGLATRLDVDFAALQVSQAELAVVRSENDIQSAFAALGTAMGVDVPPTTPLEDVVGASIQETGDRRQESRTPNPEPGTLNPQHSTLNTQPLIATALRQRPEVRQLEAQARASERLAEAARAGNRPYITSAASLGKINPPRIAPDDKIYSVGAGLTVPIFTGGLVRGQVDEALRAAAVARANLQEMENQIRQQVITALANLAASEQSLKVATAQRMLAQDALNLATQRFEAQLGTIVELNQAQVGFAQAQNDYVRALYDRELALAALNYATGQR